MSDGWTHRIDAPGRVNLIGEHIDYAGLSVLPMAIDRGLTLHLRPRTDGVVRIRNASEARGERRLDLRDLTGEFEVGDWGNYLRAAAIVLIEGGHQVAGFDGLLESDLPAAAGLSSSSALVVATALGLLAAADSEPPPTLVLASLLAEAEIHAGTRGGGMDQAAILAGSSGCAVRIDFDPLAVTRIPVPSGWSFVVAHSLQQAEKSGAARTTYNARRAAVESAMTRLGGGGAGSPNLVKANSAEDLLGASARLPAELAARFRHVVTEAERVQQADACMRRGDAAIFGELMFASHDSLARDFEVSTPALDGLVESAREAGAYGARLTGAGLGGCVVILADSAKVEEVVAQLRGTFYARLGVQPRPDQLFVALPSNGARTRTAPAPAPKPR